MHHSFRFRLAFTFALFGAMVSVLLSLGLSFTAHNQSERLIDETLRAEIDDYISRRARNPISLPPATVSILGYVFSPGQTKSQAPSELHDLTPGQYQLTLNETPYRITVVDKADERYVMMFNEKHQRNRESTFFVYLVSGTLIMTFLSAWVGWWLAGKVVAPITELGRRVDQASPQHNALDIAEGFQPDEIGKLAHVFAGYLTRMREFIDRERAFTSDVSHELRTPLAIVLGVVELMEEDTQLQEKQQERVARISRATHNMIDMTSALLLMGREASLDEPVKQKCDICEIVNHIIEMHHHLLSEQTTVNLICQSKPHIEAERTLLGVVVANLIRNALTHTPSGSITIVIDEVKLSVTDTGTGIHSEEIGQIFQRHFRGSRSKGSGIGLSLVKRICDRYGWETIIESTEGKGTTAQLIFQKPTHARSNP